MSDGNEGTKREYACSNFSLEAPHPHDYARSVLKMSVAQICDGVGFNTLKHSAMEALSDVAILYICDLGKSASLYASLCGRSQVNVFDIIKGLQDLGSSSTMKEIEEFVNTGDEIPFAQPIPRFPVMKLSSGIPSFLQMGEVPNSKHIPDWLPAFPDPHTYIHTPLWNKRQTDPQIDKLEQVKQRRKAERSLLSLQQRLVSNGLAGPSEKKHVDKSVFVDENEKKHVSVFETFGPAIEAMKGEEVETDQRMMMAPNRRPVVHFKLKAGRKMLVEDLDVKLKSYVSGHNRSWVGRDDDKDDKKRRAELILRQSMENLQESAHM